MADFDQELDASGLNCPLPILRAKKTLAPMETGQVLQTGSQQRSTGKFRMACELVRNGRIGRLQSIDVWLPAGPTGPGQPLQGGTPQRLSKCTQRR